jgi:aminopeptidase N
MDAVFEKEKGFVQEDNYKSYFRLAKSGNEEPLTTHGDHYQYNAAYSAGTYTKGAVFVEQLAYIIGKENFQKGLIRLWDEWKFKHPTGIDVVRVMEKVSGLELDWYYDYFIASTKTIDYGIKQVDGMGNNTKLTLERKGQMPMPLDVVVTYNDGKQESIYLPLVIQRGSKPEENGFPKRILTQKWPWTNPSIEVVIPRPLSSIKSIEIDPSYRLADVDRNNNIQTLSVPLPQR